MIFQVKKEEEEEKKSARTHWERDEKKKKKNRMKLSLIFFITFQVGCSTFMYLLFCSPCESPTCRQLKPFVPEARTASHGHSSELRERKAQLLLTFVIFPRLTFISKASLGHSPQSAICSSYTTICVQQISTKEPLESLMEPWLAIASQGSIRRSRG